MFSYNLWNWKTERNQKYLQKHEVKISKTIKELWKEMHKLALDCVFIKIKIEKKGKKKPFCSHHPISIKSGWKEFRIIQDAPIQLFSMFLYIYIGYINIVIHFFMDVIFLIRNMCRVVWHVYPWTVVSVN